MKGTTTLALAVLLAGLGIGRLHAQDEEKDGLEARVESLEGAMEKMGARLQKTEAFIAGLESVLRPARAEKEKIIGEINQLRNIAQTMLAMDGHRFPRRKNGLLAPLMLVLTGDLRMDVMEEIMKSPRSGVGLTVKEIKEQDYTKFPWHCGGIWCRKATTKSTPMLWEKKADSKGKLVVAFTNGSVKYMAKEDLDRVLKDLERPPEKK